MRLLVIGASGLVGNALMHAIPKLDPDVTLVGTYRTRAIRGLRRLDASDANAVTALLADARPDLVLFPAAMPDVEWCETHASEAYDANLAPLRNVLRTGVPVVAFSSDYVFDGRDGPYAEDAPRRPLSVYGRIKAELEDETLAAGGTVIRTTGVFGVEAITPAKNFVMRVIASLRQGSAVAVPSDQVATPTYAPDLARATFRIATFASERGVWHVAGPDMLSRLELARAVADQFALDTTLIRAVRTTELGQKASRPLVGGLRNARYRAAFEGDPVRSVHEALRDIHAAMRTITA